MNIEQLHEDLAAKTVAQLRAFASDQGIQLPAKGRKADLIAMVIDLLSIKAAPAEEEPKPTRPIETEAQLMRLTKAELYGVAETEGVRTTNDMNKPVIVAAILTKREAEELEAKRATEEATTAITLDCGHPLEVDHRNVFPQNVKAYLAKAKKEAVCPRCPAAVAEPEGEVSSKPEPTEEAPAPAPTKAQKSSAPRKAKAAKASKPKKTAPKAKKADKPKRELKKEPTGWGFSSKEGGHADSSKALLRAKTPDAKAEVAAGLIEAEGWTAKVVETSEEHAVLQATFGEALIVIRWQPLEAKKLDIRFYRSEDHKGAGLLNVSAALKKCRAHIEATQTTPEAVTAPALTQVAA